MVNEIKVDKISPLIGVNKAPEPTGQQKPVSPKSVRVTNHINKLVSLLNPENIHHEDNARVMATKQKIESGTYQIDTQALAEKLINSGILGEGI